MRFVWAVAAFVLATVMIGAGIAQRTIFQGPKSETASISVDEEAPFLLIDGAVLNQLPGTQTLRAQGDGEIFASYGRTADMQAWLSDSEYNHVTLDRDGTVDTALVEPVAAASSEGETAPDAADPEGESTDAAPEPETGSEADAAAGRSPAGSDLWLDEYQQSDLLIAPLQLPDEMSVLVAADGTAPAPSAVSVTWPLRTSTPWAGPLIVGGGILMAVGVFLYILGIRHARRSRGPRRKGLPVPVTEPIDISIDDPGKGVISSGAPTRRSLTTGRRAFAVVPAVAVSAILFAGCSSDAWPQLASTPTPTPSETVVAPEDQHPPAVTKAQAERILSRIADTVAEADAALDGDLAATRLEGAALAARQTNYTLRSAIADYQAPAPIVAKPLEIVLPEARDGWPRSVIAVADDAQSKTSSIMVVTQDDVWADYKLSYIGSLEASTSLPALAPEYIGAPQVEPDSPFLVLPPDQVAAAYTDIINKGEESEFFELFDAESDQLRASIVADRQRRLDDFNTTAASTGSLEFSSTPGTEAPFALQTVESGAIVAVNIHELDTVKPTTPDAVIKLDKSPTFKALAGVDQSASGFVTTFSDQLFFYVPGPGSDEKIRLLAYSSDILDAKVIK